MLEIRQAVATAKRELSEVLEGEGVFNVGLEEIDQQDDADGDFYWLVTLGFSRPWNSQRNALSAVTGEDLSKRSYRVLTIRDSDGALLSIKRRDLLP